MIVKSISEEIHNRLLLSLPKAILGRLQSSLHKITIVQGQLIDHVDEPMPYVYFVNRGFISMVKTLEDGRSVEIGGSGIEGLTNPNAVMGARGDAIVETVVQVPGTAFRIERPALKREMQKEPLLARMIEDYARFLIGQMAQTAACNRLHSMEQRCCRWLLIASDNALSDRFTLTQEFLATMLGVQRPGVSMTARVLRRSGLIEYSRGTVTILDRQGLEDEACECYHSGRNQAAALYHVSAGL